MSDTVPTGSMQEAPDAAARPGPRRDGGGAGYRFGRLPLTDLPKLNALYNACYGVERPLAEAQWLYARNPAGPAVVFGAFDAAGRLVGMRPAIPFRQAWYGQERTAYEFADALVDPAHRGRGLFSRLVRMICAWAEEEGHALYSIPNENSLPIYRRSPGLAVVEGTQTRARPLSWPSYLATRLGRGDVRGAARDPGGAALSDGAVRLRPIGRFESDFADVRADFEDRVPCFTVRSAAYLQWRYFGSPVRAYRAALIEERGRTRGYVVVRMIDGVAQIVDLFMRPDARLAQRALGLAAEWARRAGATGIHFNASLGNPFHPAAARAGYWLSKRSGELVLDRPSARELPAGRPGGDIYVVMGDFDFL